jgi:putative ABC transport system permease protein
MDLLKRLTIKNLKLNKKRTIVTIVGIILSVSLITAVASMYKSGLKSLINYEKINSGDYHVVYYNVPENEINYVIQSRDVEKSLKIKNIGYADINSKNSYKPYALVRAMEKDDMESLLGTVVEGRFPQKEDEIVIPTHLKTNGRVDIKVGDTITLDIGKRISEDGVELGVGEYGIVDEENDKLMEKLTDTTQKKYKVVGKITRPPYKVEDYSEPGYSFVTLDGKDVEGTVDLYVRYHAVDEESLYKNISNAIGIDEKLLIRGATSGFSSDEEFDAYVEEMGKAKYRVDTNDYLIKLETNPFGGDDMKNFLLIVGVVIGIIIFTSVVCIKNSFDISVTEKIKQYGMLKSVGATKKQIRKSVFFEATILGGIGIPLGLIAGHLASWILVIVCNQLLSGALNGAKIMYSFSVLPIFIAIALGIVTIYLSAFGSARKASKIAAIDLIRNSGNIKIKSKKIKSPKFIRKFFGIGGEISYKNLKRNRKKYRTTVISIIVSVAIFIALSEFVILAFDEVNDQVNAKDYNLVLEEEVDANEFTMLKKTTELENITDFSISRSVHAMLGPEQLNKEYLDFKEINADTEDYDDYIEGLKVTTLGDKQFKKYIESLGLKYEEVKDKGVLTDYGKVYHYKDNKTVSKFLEITSIKSGDEVEVEKQNDNGDVIEVVKIKVASVTDKRPFGFGNDPEPLLVVSDELFDELLDTDSAQVFYNSTNANKLQDDIEQMLGDREINMTNIDEQYQVEHNMILLAAIFLYGFIIVISLIGLTNIFNTITTNMELRKPEFAMLKSVGMTTPEFNRMIRLESLFMGLRSLMFGLPIGIGLAFVMYKLYVYDNSIKFKLPIAAISISVLLVFVLIFIIMKYSLKKIKKQNTIETIRNENI